MGLMRFDRCENCGHDGLCRYQDDMDGFLKKLGELMNRAVEASHFYVDVRCPDHYEKTYTVRKGEKK